MTTVSVRIERIDARHGLYLHNGMWGPATTVLHFMWKACQDGIVECDTWNIAEVNAISTGAVVRAALAKTDEHDDLQYWHGGNREQITAFATRLQDDARYRVYALECEPTLRADASLRRAARSAARERITASRYSEAREQRP